MARFAAYGIFLAVIGAAAGGLLYLCYRMGSNYLQNLDNFWESSCQIFYSCCEQLEKISGISTDDIRRTVTEETGSLTSSAMEYSKNAGWYMIGVLANIVVVFVAVFLMLNDYEKISAGFQKTQAGRYIVRTVVYYGNYYGTLYCRAVFASAAECFLDWHCNRDLRCTAIFRYGNRICSVGADRFAVRKL